MNRKLSRAARAAVAGMALTFLALPGGLLAQSPPPAASADATRRSGIEAVAEIEAAMVSTVAKVEASVVAIARIRRDESAPRALEQLRMPGVGPILEGGSPTSPDFIPREFGSGVVVDKNGLILTTLPVLGEISGSDYVVWVQRRPYLARVKAADPWLEVAVLQIDADNLTPIALGDAKTLKKGQLAIALGNPLATARDGEPSAAWAMIANLGRQAPANAQSGARAGRETLHHYGTLIQLDTRSMLGTSGGAVVNLAGDLVGLTTTLTSLPRQDREAGFAIPIDDDFKTALDTLKAGRLPEYGFLGIAPQSLSLPDRQAGRLGALVEDVVPGTPAAMSGIKPGDFITEVNDTPVRDDLHLIRLVSALPAESEVRVGVKRELSAQNAKSVSVVLSKKFQESARESFAEIKAAPWRGMRVEYATAAPAFRDSIRHLDPLGCVAVLEVERDSAAWKAGLRAGQFITHVDDARVLTPKQFYAAVEERQEEEEVSLRVTTSADGELVRRVAGSG